MSLFHRSFILASLVIPLSSAAPTLSHAQARPEWSNLGGPQNRILEQSAAGNFTGAIATAREDLANLEAKVGPNHIDLLDKIEQLGMLYLARSNISAAETTFKRGLAIAEPALGPTHQKTIAALNGLLAAYLMDGRMGEAEEIMKRTRANP